MCAGSRSSSSSATAISAAVSCPVSRPVSRSAFASSVSSRSVTVFGGATTSVALTPFPPRGTGVWRCRTVPVGQDERHRPNGSFSWRMVLAPPGGPQEGLGPLAKRRCAPRGRRKGELALRLTDVAEVDQEQSEVETDGLRVGEAAGQRAEPGERGGGALLVVAADSGGRERLRIEGSRACGCGEL